MSETRCRPSLPNRKEASLIGGLETLSQMQKLADLLDLHRPV